jgi:hypothetical protein
VSLMHSLNQQCWTARFRSRRRGFAHTHAIVFSPFLLRCDKDDQQISGASLSRSVTR